ncbi:MAG: ABC transporter ATP-binding protein [Actinomycetota bacterium]
MEQSRLRLAISLLRQLLKFHPRPFLIAVAGASVYAICTVASSFGLGYVVDHVIIPRYQSDLIDRHTFLVASFIVVGIGLLRAVGVVIRRSYAGISHWSTSESLSTQLIRHIMSQPNRWHQRHMTGDLVARIGVDSDTAASVLGPLPFSTSVVLLVGLTSIWLVVIDVPLGMLAVTVIPLLFALNLGYQRRIDRHFDSAQKALGDLSEAVHESFDGVMVVKAFGAEDREHVRLATISSKLKDARIRAVNARAIFEALVDGTPSLVNVSLIAYGAVRVRSGSLTIGELSSFIYLFTLLVFPLRIIGYLLSEIPHSSSGFKRVREILDEPLEPQPAVNVLPVESKSSVELKSASFSYAEDSEPILSDVSFSIPVGSIVAVVGETGSGKSTLLKMIAGLINAQKGSVHVTEGGSALVFQEPFLFSGSLHFNLTLGKSIPITDIARALWASVSEEFVSELEHGLDTIVGERGISLSGGQRQRIALARAIASGRQTLLLDDTTSALDPTTESIVIERLASLSDTTTTIIVASRPTTIKITNFVIFIHSGVVHELSTHDELMRTSTPYKNLMMSFEIDRKAS